MKATPILLAWHEGHAPIYSLHFDPNPNSKGRLATAGNDNCVRLWKIEATGEERTVSYLSTLAKHTQAVNIVRFSPKGEMLASAGDDGNILLWVPSDFHSSAALGEDRLDDTETWRVKHMCRSSGAEIYDLAWSPDGVFLISGSMDNIARIYNAQTGQMVRQIAEHSHYVQGVAWDPLNEFVATQSSDRSVHIYTLKTKDGQFTLNPHGKFHKMDLPAKRTSSHSPAPPDVSTRTQPSSAAASMAVASPVPSTPGTPMTATTLPMDPPPVSHSRRSSFGSSPSIRRSASPAASLPLPAVKPLESSSPTLLGRIGVKNASIYASETFTSFFRRLTFTPDGSLLFTPAGQYKTTHISSHDPYKTEDELLNTVYIYTRAGLNRPPIAHLSGHKKPSIAVKCSPVFYHLRQGTKATSHITLDTSSGEEPFPSLPDSVVASSIPTSNPSMEPPPSHAPHSTTYDASKTHPSPKTAESEEPSTSQGPNPAFALPYRIVYAVATQDAVIVYDTQQQSPICVVNNLHFATFTDLSWSNDGSTLIMSSSDGFCSTLSFTPGELGQPYTSSASTSHTHHTAAATSSASATPVPTPKLGMSPSLAKPSAGSTTPLHASNLLGPQHAASPRRSASISSVNTISSMHTPATAPINNPTPTLGSVPLVAATNSGQPTGLPLTTPPQTPVSGVSHSAASSISGSVLGKRDIGAASESEREGPKDSSGNPEPRQQQPKKRRIAPIPVIRDDSDPNASAAGTEPEAKVNADENK